MTQLIIMGDKSKISCFFFKRSDSSVNIHVRINMLLMSPEVYIFSDKISYVLSFALWAAWFFIIFIIQCRFTVSVYLTVCL